MLYFFQEPSKEEELSGEEESEDDLPLVELDENRYPNKKLCDSGQGLKVN